MPHTMTGMSDAAPTQKSARTRERILDAAAQVLSRRGYAGTRLTDVAAAAGVQAPAIYYYFASRDELVEEVMWTGAHRVRRHVEEVLAALPDGTAARDRLLAASAAHLRYELQISDYATAAVRNAAQIPEQLRVRPAEEERIYSTVWRELFAAAKDAGELRDDLDVGVFRLLILGSMNWAVEWWDPRVRSLEEIVQATQDMLRHAAFARP